MACLTRRTVSQAGEGPAEGFVVGEHDEGPALQDMAEVFDGEEDGEKFSVKSAILFLGIRQLLGEERHRPVVSLGQDGSNSDVGRVTRQRQRSRRVRVVEKNGALQGELGSVEGRLLSRGPQQGRLGVRDRRRKGMEWCQNRRKMGHESMIKIDTS